MSFKWQTQNWLSNSWYRKPIQNFPNAVDKSQEDEIVDLNSLIIDNRSEIVIVIDPGHGNTKGNTGATYIKAYKHKVKDTDGTVKKDPTTQVEIIEETLIDDLPDYVSAEVSKADSSWKWITERIWDHNKLERDIVWDVSVELQKIFSEAGYSAHKTREAKIIQGSDDRAARNRFATDKKAHYFISVHADGSTNYKASGSHAIYRHSSDAGYTERQREFAKDIMTFFTIVSTHDTPRKRGDLQVISPTANSSYRKSLVELGFVTNTNDYNAMSSNIEKMALQLAKGLESNIRKNYKQRVKVTKYQFGGRKYDSMEMALSEYENTLSNANRLIMEGLVDGFSGEAITQPRPITVIELRSLELMIK
jgi:N-acetylmuramoyl-L-alanine amidase